MKNNIKKNVKWLVMGLCFLMTCVALTGCMNTDNNGTQTPDAEPSRLPEMSFTPQNEATTQPQPTNRVTIDWRQMAEGVQNKINLLSEIQTSRIVVNGNTALVGVMFTDQYQGELTQRIHDMVAAEVQAIDPNIQSVAVTAEAEDVQKINEIADRIAAGTPVSEVEGEIDSIVRNMTTIQ